MTESRRFEARLSPISPEGKTPGKEFVAGTGGTVWAAACALLRLMGHDAVGERGSDVGASRRASTTPDHSGESESLRGVEGPADDSVWLANDQLDIIVARDDGDDLCFEAFCKAIHPGLVLRGATIGEVFENLQIAARD